MIMPIEFYSFLLICTCTLIYFADEALKKKSQRKYESAFLEQHRETINRQRFNEYEYIPLTFEHQEIQHLSKLCHDYRSKWTLDHYVNRIFLKIYEPRVQFHYIQFRWIKPEPKPVRVEVLRCTAAFALIEAGDGRSGYVLHKNVPEENPILMTLFSIDTKFYYKQEVQYEARNEAANTFIRDSQKSSNVGRGQSSLRQRAAAHQPTVDR